MSLGGAFVRVANFERAGGRTMIEVSNFQEQVLDASKEKPVLVDFWAPWCGPCRQLGPILEKLDAENDAFTLAKLNTDEDQTTAMRYSIRSIPAVKLFVDGEVAGEFIGALPEPQVRSWLTGVLPSEVKDLIQEAAALSREGNKTAAGEKLERVLEIEPNHAEAMVGLASVVVFKDPQRAVQLASAAAKADPSKIMNAKGIDVLVNLLQKRESIDELEDDPAKEPYVEALNKLGEGDLDGTLSALVESVRRNRAYNGEAARLACLALFNVLGPKASLTQRHQRALEMALF
jgi:putative thioredoxin